MTFLCTSHIMMAQYDNQSQVTTLAPKHHSQRSTFFFFQQPFPFDLLPRPAWPGFRSAPGCRWCTPELFSFCPTSGTEPALPSRPPGCAGAPRCTSAAR